MLFDICISFICNIFGFLQGREKKEHGRQKSEKEEETNIYVCKEQLAVKS